MTDKTRYSRHLLLPEVGEEGQKKLENSRVLVVGAGGLGSPICLYLAAAGVGTIGVADFDRVDESNLQRQILYRESDIGRLKTEAAAERLLERNSGLNVLTYSEGITEENAETILAEFDIIVDASDNFKTRYLINDTCLALGKPDVYGAICEFAGQITVFGAGGPCLRCMSPEEEQTDVSESKTFGVLGAVPGIIGCLQAAEVLKLILGTGRSLSGRMIFVDVLSMEVEEMEIPVNPRCGRHER